MVLVSKVGPLRHQEIDERKCALEQKTPINLHRCASYADTSHSKNVGISRIAHHEDPVNENGEAPPRNKGCDSYGWVSPNFAA